MQVKILQENKLGKLLSVSGVMIEQRELEQGREWLLDPKINGGGIGMDMMVHVVALGELLLKTIGLSFENLKFSKEDVLMSRYEGAPQGVETYARINGHIGEVPVSLKAGKGLHDTAYSTGTHRYKRNIRN